MEPIPLCHLDEHDDPRCPACLDSFCDARICEECGLRHVAFDADLCARCELKPTIPAPPWFEVAS